MTPLLWTVLVVSGIGLGLHFGFAVIVEIMN